MKEQQQPVFTTEAPTFMENVGRNNVRLETESAVDTMDFVNKIVNKGKTGGGELPSRSNVPGGFAERVDTFDFNFPVIPPYEGI